MPFRPGPKLPDYEQLRATFVAAKEQTENYPLYQTIIQLFDANTQTQNIFKDAVDEINIAIGALDLQQAYDADTAVPQISVDNGFPLTIDLDSGTGTIFQIRDASDVQQFRFDSSGELEGGTTTGHVLTLTGSSFADFGYIDISSTVRSLINPIINASGAFDKNAYEWRPTIPASGATILASQLFAPVVTVDAATFIYSNVLDRGVHSWTVGPGFAAFTMFSAIPTLATTTATINPAQAIIYQAAAIHRNTGAGIIATAIPLNGAVVYSGQLRVQVAGDTLSYTAQEGVRFGPTFSTVVGTTAALGTCYGLRCLNPSVGFLQPGTGVETLTAYYGVDVAAIPFGGNVPKAALRSAIASATLARFIENTSTAASEFGTSVVHWNDVGIIQMGGALNAADISLFWNGVGGFFEMFFWSTSDFIEWSSPAANRFLIEANDFAGAPVTEVSFGFERFAFGQTTAVGNQVGTFVAPARTTTIAGEWADFLLTQAGNLTYDDAMSVIAAWTINPISLTAGTGSISDRVTTLRIAGMTTSTLGGAETEALWVGGRTTQRGVFAPLALTPAALSATVNDYAPATGNSMRPWWRLATDQLGAELITGIAVQQIDDLQWITNIGPLDNITLQHQNAGSAAANRIISPTGADYVLAPDESAALKYDPITARWRIVWGTGT